MLRSSALAPFRVRSYRFQWPADLLTSWALEMEFLILGWYVLVETGLSYLIASISFGAMLGGVLMSRAGAGRDLARLLVVSAVIWHALLIIYAQMQTMTGGIVMLLLAGIVQSLSMVSLTVILVQESGLRFRGRVMGVRMLAIYSLPLGLLAAGPLIERFGFATFATLYAGLGLACTILIAWRWRAHLWRHPV